MALLIWYHSWNGAQGFQTAPSDPFFVPYHGGLQQLGLGSAQAPFVQDAGAGLLGTTHTERGLTFVTVQLSGHGMVYLTTSKSAA